MEWPLRAMALAFLAAYAWPSWIRCVHGLGFPSDSGGPACRTPTGSADK